MKKTLIIILFSAVPLEAYTRKLDDSQCAQSLFILADTGLLFEGIQLSVEKKWENLTTLGTSGYTDLYMLHRNGIFGKAGVKWSGIDLAFSPKGFQLPFTFLFNTQAGYYVHPYGGIRVGLFENTLGIGVDYWVFYDTFRWLTSLELLKDTSYAELIKTPHVGTRPRLRWINKVFLTQGFYLTFGVENIHNQLLKTNVGFVGIGLGF